MTTLRRRVTNTRLEWEWGRKQRKLWQTASEASEARRQADKKLWEAYTALSWTIEAWCRNRSERDRLRDLLEEEIDLADHVTGRWRNPLREDDVTMWEPFREQLIEWDQRRENARQSREDPSSS